jgi:hypothetical protein
MRGSQQSVGNAHTALTEWGKIIQAKFDLDNLHLAAHIEFY